MDWLNYEKLVEKVCRELGKAKGVTVFSKRVYRSTSGRDIEIDVSFELEVLGSRVFGIVECKHYARRVQAFQVLAFARTKELVRAHKGIIVSTVGFQHGAVIEAENEGIALALLSPHAANLRYVIRARRRSKNLLQGRIRVPSSGKSECDNEIGIPFTSASALIRILKG